MARVNPELKKTLEADGRWREFMLLRREKIAGGMKSADALNAAIAEVCPELARYGSLCKTGRKRVGSGAEAEGKVAEAADVVDALEERKRVKENGRLVDAKVFDGKAKACAADEVLWVAEHLNVKVEAEDAPGALAWNLLVLCRESADFRVKFMLNIASDVVKRRTDCDGDRDRLDGQAEYDILSELGGDGQ